jgi:hypothetical protein
MQRTPHGEIVTPVRPTSAAPECKGCNTVNAA